MAENIAEEILTDVEDMFHPRPGGIVDRHRKEKALREAAEKQAENAAEPVHERSYRAIKVIQLSPEITRVNSVTVPSNGTTQILPRNEYRYRAMIVASGTIVLAPNQSQALGQVGYSLPANTPMEIRSRAQLWAYATASATVSVYSENYSREENV